MSFPEKAKQGCDFIPATSTAETGGARRRAGRVYSLPHRSMRRACRNRDGRLPCACRIAGRWAGSRMRMATAINRHILRTAAPGRPFLRPWSRSGTRLPAIRTRRRPASSTSMRRRRKWACTRIATRRISPRPSSRCRSAISCLFRIGGRKRADPTRSLRLHSGDVVALGGDARLAFHGVDRIYAGTSTLLRQGGRISLTMRRVTRPASAEAQCALAEVPHHAP